MKVLNQCEPKEVFAFFEEICAIPHGSGNIWQISNYLVEFAKQRKLTYYQDTVGNVIIVKKATEGYESEETVILQGHMDMVAVKKPELEIDLKKEGLQLAIDGDNVYAKGTSLGGDDGIAVAYALALLDSNTIEHPGLEVIITVDEETGLEGAREIDVSMLQGKRLLNLDSEEEGIFLTSCAGGVRVNCVMPVIYQQKEGISYQMKITGLQGGHSGCEIEKERGNTNWLTGRGFVYALNRVPFSVSKLEGGLADNAIPRETKVELVVDSSRAEELERTIRQFEAILKNELRTKDPQVRIELIRGEAGHYQVLEEDSMKNMAALIFNLPNGVQAMSAEISGLVETSLNLGIMRLDKDAVTLSYSVRSSVESSKEMLKERLVNLTGAFGGNCNMHGEYPGWEYRKDSALRDKMIAVYKKLYGKEPLVQALHAGLECGFLVNKIPGLDCVSFGPDMKDIHTTEETLSISSTKRVWEYVLEFLKTKG